jgi:hypothetical protein
VTSCDQQFFPYALIYKPGASETAFVTPSQTLDGDLVTGAGGGGGQGGTVVFQQAGTYLAARQGASYKSFTLPLVDGVRYKKATVDFDMFIDRFPKGLFAGVMSLRRNDRTLFYGLIIRGDRQKTVLDMGIKDDVVTGGNGGPSGRISTSTSTTTRRAATSPSRSSKATPWCRPWSAASTTPTWCRAIMS